MKRRVLISLLLITIAMGTNAQRVDSVSAGNPWSLKQCIDYALANSLLVKRSTYNVQSSEVDLRQAQFSRLPNVNGSVSYGYSWGRGLDPVSNDFVTQEITSSNAGANASLPLFNGLRIHHSIKQNQQAYAATKMDLEKTKNDLIINVATLFINVVFNKELTENARLQLASSQQQLERTKRQVQAGSLPRSEELNLDAQVATNEVNLVQQENSLNLFLLQLKQALQMPASQPLDVEVPSLDAADLTLDQTRDEIYDISRQVMPEIKSASLRIESSYHAIKAARGNLYPRLSLVGAINTNYSSTARTQFQPDGSVSFSESPVGYVNQDMNSPVFVLRQNGVYTDSYTLRKQFKDNIYRTLGVQLSIPLFNGFTSRASVQRSIIQNQQAKIDADETANTLRQNVETAYNNAVAASKSYNANTRQVQAREEAFRMTKQRYEIGALNYVDYQVAENDLFRAKSDLLRAKYEFIFRKKILDLYQGKQLDY
jgi:outer membrane protein